MNAINAGRRFEFRNTSQLAIPIPSSLPRPTPSELRGAFPWIKEIECDSSPTSAGMFQLGTASTLFEGDDDLIGCEEFERRVSQDRHKLLGYQQGIWIVKHQDEFPEMEKLQGKVNILLPGLIVVDNSKDRRMFFLGSGGRGWWLSWRILNHRMGFTPRDLIAFSG